MDVATAAVHTTTVSTLSLSLLARIYSTVRLCLEASAATITTQPTAPVEAGAASATEHTSESFGGCAD
jgi:hypothetical protein